MFYCTDHVEAHIASNPHLLPEGIKAPTCTNSAAWRTGALKSSAAKAKNMGAKKKKKATATTPKPATKAAKKAKVTAKAAASAAAAANADESNSEQFNDVNDMECENASDDDTIDTADETAEEVQEDYDSDDDNDDDKTEANAAASQEGGLVFSPIAMANSVLSMSARTNCSQRGPRRSRRAFEAAGSGAANKGNCLAFCMVYPAEEVLDVGGSGNQATRDFIRLCELQRRGYSIYTVDRWHPEEAGVEDHHLSADFKEPRRFFKSFKDKWGGMQFPLMVFDYFWAAKGGWAACWGRKLISVLVPTLVEEYGVKELFFPNTMVSVII
eukprot:9954-Heterococcus_DN1.PRE.1